MTYSSRAATELDEDFLREMQYLALFVPQGADPLPRSVVDEPHIARYHRGFGTRPGDAGRIAVDASGRPIGAAWVRRSTADDPSYGYVDDDTPELGIAVVDDRRGEGIGASLITELLAEVGDCSLSVDRRNPAARLYGRLGFVVWHEDDDTLKMIHRTPPRGEEGASS